MTTCGVLGCPRPGPLCPQHIDELLAVLGDMPTLIAQVQGDEGARLNRRLMLVLAQAADDLIPLHARIQEHLRETMPHNVIQFRKAP